MIELFFRSPSDGGDKLLLSAHPDANSAGYFVNVSADMLEALSAMVSMADEQADIAADLESTQPEEEPVRELPTGPIEVESPAEALEAAHGLWLVNADDEASDVPLHDAVLANLHKWNVRIDREILDEGWWVTKLGDQAWQISFRFLSRGRIHEAEWVLDTETARLVPENDLAATIGWVRAKKVVRSRPKRRRGGRGRTRRTTNATRR